MAAGTAVLEASVMSSPDSPDAGKLPAGTLAVDMTVNTSWNDESGKQSRDVTSAGSYVVLSGLGASDTVTRATFLYVRASADVSVRITQATPGGGGDTVSELHGPLVFFKPRTDSYLKLVEVKGVARVEWYLCGSQ